MKKLKEFFDLDRGSVLCFFAGMGLGVVLYIILVISL